MALDGWVREQVATVPAPDRRIVTFHDAFPYLRACVRHRDRRRGRGGARDRIPSAGYTARADRHAFERAGVKAIFSERQFPAKLVDQLAAETGAKVVADLYDD